jgi:hypothetical protein
VRTGPGQPAATTTLGKNVAAESLQTLVLGGAVVFVGILLIDFGVAKYQEIQVRERGARIAKLADIALSRLQSEVQSVSDLGDGRYELAVYLWNAAGDQSIYVMSPDMRAAMFRWATYGRNCP